MFDLFHALARYFNLPWRCLLSLLDERVKHHDATTNQSAEEDPSYSFGAFKAQLKETVAERVRVGRAEIRTHNGHSASKNNVASGQRIRQGKDLLFDFLAVVIDLVVHRRIITKMLCGRQRLFGAESSEI